jgi:hypothetical protein
VEPFVGEGSSIMQRCWFKVWSKGQVLDPPVPEDDLPRRVHIVGNLATYHGRGKALVAIYVLAADAAQARELFEQARTLIVVEQAPS